MINKIYGGWGFDWRVFVWRYGFVGQAKAFSGLNRRFVVQARIGLSFGRAKYIRQRRV